MATRVAVVGTCASGKSSVVAGLREYGIEAWAVGQEHSAIAGLWRHQQPDRLVYLDTTLETVRRRRDDHRWPEWIFKLQKERLVDAREHADIVVDTNQLSLEDVVAMIRDRLAQ